MEGDRPESDESISSLQAALAMTCPVCHKTFEGRNCKQNLGFHMGVVPRALMCPFCHKVFAGRNQQQRLRYHTLTHTGEKPHACPYCPHRARLKFNLHKHIRALHKDQLPTS
ncbi:hypothetical protein Pmani_018746 [Petrolisthes manimaculis]|uniref:C2H2-type domain-containing protein n=1 Tax=Petrolisthes manimaculis TaxID=1843537 RepID=A0AAE1U828_9EUCA|nr:hypothetical protein Pmani_018746 [Petrolisthes manimaculis]